MKSLYLWMTFQILVGIWLFISPFALGFGREFMSATTNNMIFGAIVVILGFGVSFYEYYHREEVLSGMEHSEKRIS